MATVKISAEAMKAVQAEMKFAGLSKDEAATKLILVAAGRNKAQRTYSKKVRKKKGKATGKKRDKVRKAPKKGLKKVKTKKAKPAAVAKPKRVRKPKAAKSTANGADSSAKKAFGGSAENIGEF